MPVNDIMTDKQRYLVYIHLAELLASLRKKNNVSISDALKTLLAKDVIQKLEDSETGYYLESGAYLESVLL